MPSVSLTDFFADLVMSNVTAQIDKNTSTDETGGGALNRSSYGTRLWHGTVTVSPRTHAEAEIVQAKIQYLEEADVTFRVSPAWRLGETATTGTVDAINADRRIVTLSEARPVGDVFGIVFSTNKRSMHRVFSVAGLVHTVTPALPFGVVATDVATFGKPEIEAVLDESALGTFVPASVNGISFGWRQTY